MAKIKSLLFLITLLSFSTVNSLIVRFSLFTKKIQQTDGSYKLQRVFLCGDNHTIGTPENNLRQFYMFLEKLHEIIPQPLLLVENQRLASQWFNDPIDHQVEGLMQQDLDYALKLGDQGKVTVLSLFGLPAKYFPPRYRPDIQKLTITNLECRQFLYYTTLLDYKALQDNFSDTTLLGKFKQLQEQKNKKLTLESVFMIPTVLDSYSNNSDAKDVKTIFSGIKNRITANIEQLKELWRKKLPTLQLNESIGRLTAKYQRTNTKLFNGYPVHYRINPFIETACISLIESQFMDEMIEANALWNITRKDASKTILVLAGATHSGHFDLMPVSYTLAEHLETLGYEHITSFGLENIFEVDETFCLKASTDLPRELFTWFSKKDGDLNVV